MLKYQFFPRSSGIISEIEQILDCFKNIYEKVDSSKNKLNSNNVLQIVKKDLEKINFRIEKGKLRNEKIPVPVLFGLNNKIDKSFDVDGISSDGKIIIEVEAGRAVINYQFLKDIFQASMMFGVEYLILAVRNNYRGIDDFTKVYTFLETMYISNRIQLPLKGILLIGY